MRPCPRPLAPTVLLAALAIPALSGCGGGGSSTGSAAATGAVTSPRTATAGSTATPAAATSSAAAGSGSAAGNASCTLAPADLVGRALGDTVGTPQQTTNGPTIVVCTYQGPKVGHLIVRIQTDQGPAGFAAGKKTFAAQGMTTKDESGIGDQAYSGMIGTGSYRVTTLVALHGDAEILVTGRSTIPAEKKLIEQLFARL